jgi:hypothetical protein
MTIHQLCRRYSFPCVANTGPSIPIELLERLEHFLDIASRARQKGILVLLTRGDERERGSAKKVKEASDLEKYANQGDAGTQVRDKVIRKHCLNREASARARRRKNKLKSREFRISAEASAKRNSNPYNEDGRGHAFRVGLGVLGDEEIDGRGCHCAREFKQDCDELRR